MELVQVSNRKVVAERLPPIDPSKIKGGDWFPQKNPNIAILAKKNSGKTVVIQNILKRVVGKHTSLFFFVSTISHDATWKSIKEQYEKTHNVYSAPSITEDGVNALQEFMKDNDSDSDDEETTHVQPPQMPQQKSVILFTPVAATKSAPSLASVEEKKEQSGGFDKSNNFGTKPQYKPKKIYPKVIFVFDDLGDECRDKYLAQLLKTNRHYDSMTITSIQNIRDLTPASWKQMDFILVFGKLPEENLLDLKKTSSLGVDDDKLIEMYTIATAKKYNFLYINRTTNESYRKNFTHEFKLT